MSDELSNDDKMSITKHRIQFYHRRAMQVKAEARTSLEQQYLDGQLEVLEQLLAEILQLESGGEIMEIGDNALVVKIVKLSDIKLRRKRTDLDERIIGYCKQLDQLLEQAKRDIANGVMKPEDMPGGLMINPDQASYQNISNRVSDLRDDGSIDRRFTITKAGDACILIKKDEPVKPGNKKKAAQA